MGQIIKYIRLKTAAERAACHPVHMKRIATDPKYKHLGCPQLIVMGPRFLAFVESEFDAWLTSRARQRSAPQESATT